MKALYSVFLLILLFFVLAPPKIFSQSCDPKKDKCILGSPIKVTDLPLLNTVKKQAQTPAVSGTAAASSGQKCSPVGDWTFSPAANDETITITGGSGSWSFNPGDILGCPDPLPLTVNLGDGSTFSYQTPEYPDYVGCRSTIIYFAFQSGSSCNIANSTQVTIPDLGVTFPWAGYLLIRTDSISLTPTAPTIPKGSVAVSGKVLTRSYLEVTVVKDAAPDVNAVVSLTSDRPNEDQITAPAPTNALGNASGIIETRHQAADDQVSTVTASVPDFPNTATSTIQWLPADYETGNSDLFLVTCYVTALESNYLSSEEATAPGLPAIAKFHAGFLKDTKLQGSGLALDGKYIHFNKGSGTFNYESCPTTAVGSCVEEGVTVAVDRTIIPLRSSIHIDTLGARKAQDAGQAIQQYHIDEYYGFNESACIKYAGHRYLGTKLTSY